MDEYSKRGSKGFSQEGVETKLSLPAHPATRKLKKGGTLEVNSKKNLHLSQPNKGKRKEKNYFRLKVTANRQESKYVG